MMDGGCSIQSEALLTSRKAARAAGHKYFLAARDCRNGHDRLRYSGDGRCVICTKDKYKNNRSDFARRSRLWYLKNREKVFEKTRTLRGIPLPTRPKPAACECCGDKVKEGGTLRVDHDHSTGEFRGYLCISCNLGIGQLGDTLEGLKRAVAYLERIK